MTIPTVSNSSPFIGPDISGDSHGRSMDSHKAWHPIGQLRMVPSIISYKRRTDHGPCTDLYVYKQARIYETVPRLPTCDILLHCSALLPHCFTSYSSAFAQHCIVAYPAPPPCCTRVYPHRFYPPRVSPSDPVSLLQVRPLPPISSESQHALSFYDTAAISVTCNVIIWIHFCHYYWYWPCVSLDSQETLTRALPWPRKGISMPG